MCRYVIILVIEETVSKYFRYNRTFESVDREIAMINNQVSIFDFI